MKRDQIYNQLENKLVKYKDLISIAAHDNGNDFVTLPQKKPENFGVIGQYEALTDMKENFPFVPVRTEVKERLDQADFELKQINPNLQLVVAYGYRSLEIQQKYFEIQKQGYLTKEIQEEENLEEVIHRLIAVPYVAGHPTGGAVDVYIQDNVTGAKLDFGVPLFTLDSKDLYTFSPFISDIAKQNRLLLRKIMLDQGFAPYDGEWWHFSFGDKEWAFYYQKPYAIYEQKSERFVANSLPKKINFSILRPGGNETALVVGVETNSRLRKKINDQIMNRHTTVEQVGFVNLDLQNAELMMAGGEFCGNATRSTVWQILKGQPGEILIKVSGVSSKLKAGVDKNGNAWAQMPIYADPSRITFLENGTSIVAMEGITHVVMNDEHPNASPKELKKIAHIILQKLKLTQSDVACGVMFVSPSILGFQMRSVVFVRDINTLFYETACGSGTTAVGLLEAVKQNKSVNFPVIQPTGIPIHVSIIFDGVQFRQATISGPITVVAKNHTIFL